MKNTLDLEKLYRQQLGQQPALTQERWAELFAARDRQGIILQALAYVRKYNAKTPQFIKDDVGMYATQVAVEVVDHCLATNKEPDKSSAYIRQSIIHAISRARKGKARDFVSTNVRTSEPRTKTNKELETKLRKSGLSESMTEAELFSAGFQPCSRTRAVEDQWPVRIGDGQSLDFAGNASGKRHNGNTLESQSTSDDWELLEEILTTEQCDLLRLRAMEMTQDEIATQFQVPASEQNRIMRAIRERVTDYQRQHPDDV